MKLTVAQSVIAALGAALVLSALADPVPRSRSAVEGFKRQNPCPANGAGRGSCPGYVVDHIKPLACGGADAPANMQWQTVQEGKEKDRWERIGCKAGAGPALSADGAR